ncbi:MAG: helix-turn-helix transcriptional regulator [Sulfuritalea sp.]|nr:helix-turn-helix transcriptional regulator [Sulfuritalea sp.]
MSDAAENCRMDIGQAINAIRKRKQLKLDAVAYDAGTDTGYLSRIENDGRKPSLKMLEQIAAALDTPVSSIFALSEGRGEKARLPDDFTEDDTGDHAAELMQLRRSFRALTPTNRRIAVELLKTLERTQSDS